MAERSSRFRRTVTGLGSKTVSVLPGLGRRLLASTLSALIVIQPIALRAQEAGAAPNGVPMVNIVTPNDAGLSHNKYDSFNVGTPGLILNNNNQDVGLSQLGGVVPGNPNLATSGPASVILNEVTGTNRSLLEGMVEVYGAQADVIIANPNGVTCNGCGFLNTPRTTLTTGLPEIGADGRLTGFRVERGDVLIGEKGANLGSVSVFDIVSRRISVNGPVLSGGELNLIAGRNAYDYASGLVTPLGSDGEEPGIAIDSSLLGGMYAGKIKVISTDRGAGVRMSGQMAANAGAMSLSADGKLTLGKARATQTITARSTRDVVEVTSTLFSDEAIALEGMKGVTLRDGALVAATGDVSLRGSAVTLGEGALAASGTAADGTQGTSGTLSVEADTVDVRAGQLAGAGRLSVTAKELLINRASDDGVTALRSRGDMILSAERIAALNANVTAAGDITLRSDAALALEKGRYASGGDLLAQAASLTSTASLAALGSATLASTSGALKQNGEISANGGVSLTSAADMAVNGRTVSASTLSLLSAGALTTGSGAVIAADGKVTISAASIRNDGIIGGQSTAAGNGLEVTSLGALENTGTLSSRSDALVTAGGALSNSGTMAATGALALSASGSTLTSTGTINGGTVTVDAGSFLSRGSLVAYAGALNLTSAGALELRGETLAQGPVTLATDGATLFGGRLVSAGLLTLEGISGELAGAVRVASSASVNGGAGVSLKAASLVNEGALGSSGGALNLALSGNLDNTGLLYGGTDLAILLDGTLTNVNADILAERNLTIAGRSATRAAAIDNRSATIEAVSGNMALAAGTITNRRDGLVVTTETTRTTSTSGNTTTTVETSREKATANGPAGQILTGGTLTVSADTLTNSYSQIASGGDMTLAATTVVNEGRDLIETVVTENVTQHSQRYCARRILGICISRKTRYWTTTDTDTASSTYDQVFGTIVAGGDLNADVTGFLTNSAVREAAGQIGLASGDRALDPALVEASTAARDFAETGSLDISIDGLIGREATFETAQSPDAPFLIETRSEFVDLSKYLSSDYFLSRTPDYDPAAIERRFGDAYAEFRLIREQIFNQTGTLDLGLGLDPMALMRQLYDNALAVQGDLQLTPGVALTKEQAAALTQDIVWLEKRRVNGQEVLVPRLYLAAVRSSTQVASAQIRAGGDTTLAAGGVANSGLIATAGDLRIDTDFSTVNEGGSLFAGADIIIDAGSLFANRSGTVSGGTVVINADIVANDTLKQRDTYFNGYADRIQQVGRIEARNDLLINASGSILSEGGRFAGGEDLVLTAGDAVEISALQLERSRDDTIKGGYDRASSLTHTLAELSAGGSILVDAGGNLTLAGAELEARRTVTLDAGGNLAIISVQDQFSRDLKLDIKTSGLLGTETNIRRQASGTETRRTTLLAGEDIAIISRDGNIALGAARLQSGGETRIEAENGQVALLTTTDQSYRHDSKREEDLLWWNSRDQGQLSETIAHVEIEAGGGVKIDAGNGIIVEYHKTGSFEASIEQLAAQPGLSWVGELRNDPALAGKVDWQAVETRFEQWDYKEQGLTEAGAALVTLVATALTAGSGGLTASLSSSLATSLGVAGNVALEAALQAGVQALINKTAVALVNNRGNLGGALEELGSSATLRSLVTSMVTAGLTAHLMDVSGIGANLDPQAPLADRIVQDLQRGLIRASVTAGVEATINGQPLGDALISALRQQAALVLGETLAEEIGAAVHEGGMQRLPQLIAHAAVGCLTGSVATGDCKGGAAGAFAGELTADAISAMIEDDLREAFARGTLSEAEAEHMVLEWRESGVNVARLAGGLAAALAGGDVDTGADAGGNAAENNAFWIPVIAVIVLALEVTDKVLLAKDAVDISMAVYACNGGDTAACSQAEEMAKQAALDAGIELSIGSIVPGSKAGADLIRWVRKNADADTLRTIDRAADAAGGTAVSPGRVVSVDDIPGVGPTPGRGGFSDWFDSLSADDFAAYWSNPATRTKMQRMLREPGGFHEWAMVSRADKFHNWGFSARDIWSFRTSTQNLTWINPQTGLPGRHGGHGSGAFHHELSQLIDSSNNVGELRSGLISLSHRWNIPNLPDIIGR
ncbi:DUF637 domain-containing protein [Pannonibacter phragmitetus]|uniref:two-partner secretion domain-containing protein n=1 Tax=Pannonibacter phragmitetus TaxID=121719 RepID=UPI003D2F4D8C